mmetsp:Transcript_112026/g.349133  ORF Transcript_112026/g.349133 Transcript_112026/m.349133 type:complete len:352 (-) Transcript_112026:830-1885(-)
MHGRHYPCPAKEQCHGGCCQSASDNERWGGGHCLGQPRSRNALVQGPQLRRIEIGMRLVVRHLVVVPGVIHNPSIPLVGVSDLLNLGDDAALHAAVVGGARALGGDAEAVAVLDHQLAEQGKLVLCDLLRPSLCRGGEVLQSFSWAPLEQCQRLLLLNLQGLREGLLRRLRPLDHVWRQKPARVDKVRHGVERPERGVGGPRQCIAGPVSEGVRHAGHPTMEGHVDGERGVIDAKPQETADRCREMAPQLGDEIPARLLRAHGPLVDVAAVAVVPDDGPCAEGRPRGPRANIRSRIQHSALVVVPHVSHDIQCGNLALGLDVQRHAALCADGLTKNVALVGLAESRVRCDG